MSERDELQTPDAASADPNSFEVLRVWVADKGQHVSLRTGVWDDPFAWGIMLADLARHVANAFEQESGRDRGETLRRIKAGLDAELGAPTDKPFGRLLGRIWRQ